MIQHFRNDVGNPEKEFLNRPSTSRGSTFAAILMDHFYDFNCSKGLFYEVLIAISMKTLKLLILLRRM